MDLGLAGQAAIVTGAGAGIGRAIALGLAAEGAKGVIASRTRAPLDAVADEIAAAGGTALVQPTDIASAAAIEALVAATIEAFGRVDVLVNNAGGQRRRLSFDQLTDQDFIEAYEDNVLSVVRTTRACLPHMRAQGGGRIVNISSEVALQPDRIFQHYTAAKAAQLNLSKSLSKALARDGVIVNSVSPGLILTDGVARSFAAGAAEQGRPVEEAKADFFRKFKPGVVLGRGGEAEEVAAVVLLLASPRASYVTGVNVAVDGGAVVGL